MLRFRDDSRSDNRREPAARIEIVCRLTITAQEVNIEWIIHS